MSEQIRQHIEQLSDTRAGWVTRRDAAEALGAIAAAALGALEAHRGDSDRDVQSAVIKALEDTGGKSGGPAKAAPGSPKEYSFTELIAELPFRNKRVVTMMDGGCRVELAIDRRRRQLVYVTPYAEEDGAKMIRIYTRCGTATPAVVNWAMQMNARLLDCAFALLQEKDKEEMLILINNIEQIHATPGRVKGAVKEVARYGDYLEKRLTREDVH